MTLTREEILQATRRYVAGVTGCPLTQVLAAHSDPVRLATPHIVVDVVTDTPEGQPQVVEGEVGGQWSQQTHERRDVRIAVQGFGAEAYDWLAAVAGRWREGAGAALALREAGVRVYRATGITNIAAYLQTGSEPRCSADLLAYAGRAHAVSVGVDSASRLTVEVGVSRESGDIGTIDLEVP